VAVVWFRRDLRLEENPAWSDATNHHASVLAIFVIDDRLWDSGTPVRQAQLISNLVGLDEALADAGGRLFIDHGDPPDVLTRHIERLGATALYWNNDVTAASRKRDDAVEATVGVTCHRSWGTLVHPPGSVLTQKGTLSRVYTPFAKRWLNTPIEPWAEPGSALVLDDAGAGVPEANPDVEPAMAGGPAAADERLARWLDGVDDYLETRNLPDIPGTSELSVDLKFGTISPRTVLAEIGGETEGRAGFIKQLAWRDWYAHLFHEMPHMINRPMRSEYAAIAWRDDPEGFKAWCDGRTGYPIVDAGMRQLTSTGWMHNRVRMITASFLVKHLLIDWTRGEKFFRTHLLDGDVAQNAGNWQWVAGTGPDAAPYFRIFNPVSQSKKFDVQGDYIRTYVPELAHLSNKAIHAPYDEAPLDLAGAGVTLGDTYPWPIVELAEGRDRCLVAYKAAKEGAA